MNSYLGISVKDLKDFGGIDTAKEISCQPELWRKTYELIVQKRNEIHDFLEAILAIEHLDVVLTGAGTSAFIGLVLEGAVQKNLNVRVRSIATTDLVTHPENFFKKNVPTLLVSFARSGNSPESVAAVNLADKTLDTLYNLIITCNESGYLAKIDKGKNSYIINLPKESNDKGLAMTGSFTSMVLAGYLISKIDNILSLKTEVEQIIKYGKYLFSNYCLKLFEISKLPFTRAIFLGSGPLYGCAKESHLKLQEMTDGRIICKNDSFLGFRHGPKAVINKDTLVVFLFSNNDYVKQYELDLVKGVKTSGRGEYSLGIGKGRNQDIDLDDFIDYSNELDKVDECLLTIVSVLPGQILGFYKSLEFGLNPDRPSKDGTITRVVEGVKIYSYSNGGTVKNLVD